MSFFMFKWLNSDIKTNLLQCGVRHSVTGDAEVEQLEVQVFEKCHKGSVLSGAVGQDVGQLVAQVLHQPGGRDVAQDETRD